MTKIWKAHKKAKLSQSSHSSEKMESSKEEEEEINHRSRIREEVCNRHQAELEALIINEYEQDEDSTEVAPTVAPIKPGLH